MAGFSGQDIALDVDTPSQLEQAAAQADLTKTQSELARQTLPADVQYKQALASNAQSAATQSAMTAEQQTVEWGLRKAMAAQMTQHQTTLETAAQQPAYNSDASQVPQSPLATAGQSGSAQVATPVLFSPAVDQVMHSINPTDPNASAKWDAAMTAAARSDPSAAQFVGKYSPGALKNWLAQIGSNAVAQAAQGPAQSPLAQAGQPGAATSPLQNASAPASPLAPQAPAPAPQPMAARAPNGELISPLTGQPDQQLTQYAILFPDKAPAMIKQQGLLRYIKTGDINDLKRFDPDEYAKVVEAQKNLNEAQKIAIQTKADTLGQSAFAFLGVARQFGVNSPQALGAWTRAITEAANDGFMDPKEAAQRIAQGPDVGFATYSYLRAMVVSEAMKATGQTAEAEAKAKQMYPAPEYRTVKDAFGQEHIWSSTGGSPGSSGAGASSSGTPFSGKIPFSALIGAETGGTQFGADGKPLTSPKGAVGIAQIMPSTGPEAAALAGVPWDLNRYHTDPQYNAALGSAYYRKLQQRYGDDVKAAAAYNAGMGRVDKAIASGGNNWLALLPAETRQYVGKVAGSLTSSAINQQKGQGGIVYSASDSANGQNAFGVDPSITGAAVLDRLPPNIRPQVQQLLDGRRILTAREKGTPLGQQLMQIANQVDPTYDEAAAHARLHAVNDFTGGGKQAIRLAAGDRMAAHVSDLWNLSQDLGGPDVGFAPVSNMIASTQQAFKQKTVGAYNSILTPLSGELQSLIKVGAITEGESNKIIANLRPNQPQDVRDAAIREVVRLGMAQQPAAQTSWESAFQGAYKPKMPRDFSPVTQNVFNSINSAENTTIGKLGPNGLPVSQHGAPPRMTTRDQVAALPHGSTFIWVDGKVHTRK